MSDPLSQELPCHNCGYDLRAHPKDGTCPECRASIATSLELAAIPTRPSWQNSDPRWRRRILLGLWTLTLLPILSAAQVLEWTAYIPVPVLFDYKGNVQTLDHTLASYGFITLPIIFICGLVLLFAKERNRRAAPFEWTRRWGVFFCYLSLILVLAEVLFLPALVLAGIAAVFHSIPLEFAPSQNHLLANLSYLWLRYGPYPTAPAMMMLTTLSSLTIVLACATLYNALRSITHSRRALLLLTPLIVFALLYLSLVALALPNLTRNSTDDVFAFRHYFDPENLARNLTGKLNPAHRTSLLSLYQLEAIKFLSLLSITLYLTYAQLLTHFRRSPQDKQPPA